MKNGGMIAVLVLLAGLALAEEKATDSRIVAVSLFKNGLAVVKHRVVVPGAGTYRLEDLPDPVHGTFWLTSDARVTTRSTTRMVEEAAAAATDLPRELAGREVTVHFTDGKTAPLIGTVVAPDDPARPAVWSRDYTPPDNYYGYRSSYQGYPPATRGAAAPYLVLATADGHAFIQPGQVGRIDVKGALAKAKRRKPVLLCTVDTDQKTAAIEVSYLTKGLAWMPSYRLDTTDPKTLQLEQSAVIRNELADLKDVEIDLISGYPNIEFAHVTSPLSMHTSLAAFFAQLDQRPGQGSASARNVVSQQMVMANAPPAGAVDLTARPAGEGVDLHYAAIGRHTLAEGDALALTVATDKAAYERIVEWSVPDTRRADGRQIEPYERQQNPDAYQDEAWDALRFKNPLPYPMTTAAVMIVDHGRFSGQCLSTWVNSGETAILHVTKALSVRTRHTETEEAKGRVDVNVGGDSFWRVPVKGELMANNHRNEAITLVVRRRFSGELVSADQKPQSRLLEEGVYAVNPRNELTWELKLKPGEEVKLAYAYTVLVRH